MRLQRSPIVFNGRRTSRRRIIDGSIGSIFADRLRDVGFLVKIYRVTPAQEIVFGLLPMEWLYVATRPNGVDESRMMPGD